MVGKQYLQDLKKYRPKLKEIAGKKKLPYALIWLDCVICAELHGSNVPQYLGFSMYDMRNWKRSEFVTTGRTKKIVKILNNASDAEKRNFDDKSKFNRLYSKFIKRDWIYSPETEHDEFIAFLKRNPAVIVKPSDQSKGAGIFRIQSEEILSGDCESFIREMKEKRMVLESFIQQHHVISRINPSSVNTIRIATVRDKNRNVYIIGASLRAGGKGKIVDNLHSDGVQYPINVDTGIVSGGGTNHAGDKNILRHPSTNVEVVGIEIPHWDMIKETVSEAAKLPENVRYVGWDIAVTEDGCELIEANLNQGCNGMQLDGIGKYKMIKKRY